MPAQLLLFPFGGNAREALLSVLAVNRAGREWDVIGFMDDDSARKGDSCCGVPVLGGREVLRDFPDAMLLAVPGSPSNFHRRLEIIDGLGVEMSRFATVIHPSVSVAPDARVGRNTLVMPNVVVSCGVRVGNHCVILPNTVISHDSSVDDCCCIGSNVSVSGSVSIGFSCYIGSGTRMRENIAIGSRSLVGLGANVISDLPANVIAAGNPARVLKSRPSTGTAAERPDPLLRTARVSNPP